MSASRLVVLGLCLSLPACSVGNSPRDGSGGDLDGGVGRDSGVRRDAGFIDPFDPDAACGVATIPTEQVPGSLLIVFDRSGSMDEPANGDTGPTKWDLAVMAINNVMSSVPNDLSAGLLLFPTGSGSDCTVSLGPDVPQVPVASLADTRAQIMSELTAADPTGGNTPMFSAMRAGYDYLDTLTSPGQRGLVVVTDGAETCDTDMRDAVMQQVEDERINNGYLTFAVGLDHSNNDLSTIAYNGGTPRTPTCLPECTSDICETNADCPAGATCNLLFGLIGQCTCTSDAHCIAPQTCEDPGPCPFPDPTFCMAWPKPMCGGDSNCCHYDASGSTFQSDFEMALDAIARRFLDSCVFDVPRGTDPSMFNAQTVNVGVTFTGEEREVLRQGSDSSVNSWNYVPGTDNRSLIIQGPICDQLLMGDAVVEIVLGCPTILI